LTIAGQFTSTREIFQDEEADGWPRVWGRDGRELFYVDAEQWLVAVPIRTSPTIDIGPPAHLFKVARGEFQVAFDVDGRGRFLSYVIENSGDTTAKSVQNVILNWPARLGRR
jgi:hypothetical protein